MSGLESQKKIHNASLREESSIVNQSMIIDEAELLHNAEVLMQSEDYGLAINMLEKIDNISPKQPRMYSYLGFCHGMIGNHNLSIQYYRRQLNISPTAESMFMLACALYDLEEDTEALGLFKEAERAYDYEAPELFDLFKNIGNIYVKQAKFDEAEAYYQKAFNIDSESDVIRVNFGTLAIQRNDFDSAAEHFRNAIHLNHLNDKAWVGLALVHRQFGDFELSWANIESALDCNICNDTAMQLAVQWAQNDNKISVLSSRLEDHLNFYPNDHNIRLINVKLFILKGSLEEAYQNLLLLKETSVDANEVRELNEVIFSMQEQRSQRD